MQRLYPPPVCHLVPTRQSKRISAKLRDGYPLDDVLTILDEHYNNMKALDALNQELFQLWMADKETILDWGVCLSRHLQVLAASFPDHLPPNCVAK